VLRALPELSTDVGGKATQPEAGLGAPSRVGDGVGERLAMAWIGVLDYRPNRVRDFGSALIIVLAHDCVA
jgi:hypothetical protein